MTQKLLVFYITLFSIIPAVIPASAYKGTVHFVLNESAVKNFSQVNTTLKTELGILEGVDSLILKDKIIKEIWQWLAYGGEAEDFGMPLTPVQETTTRAFNHFHDPLRDWDEAGLDAIINLVYAGNYGRFPVSLLLWGLDPGQQDFQQNTTGDWSWSKAREHYFTFLTGHDFSGNVIADTDEAKKSVFADCLRAVGQMMHLVQDASVPMHTRNDVHILPGTYETFVTDNITRLMSSIDEVRPALTCLSDPRPDQAYSYLPPVTGLIDRNQYAGQGIPAVNAAIGLAEYSNANFLTEDTMWQYPHPDLADTSYNNDTWLNPEAVDAEDGVVDNRIYFRKEAGQPIDHLMAAAYWYCRLYRSQSPALAWAFLLDETCYETYADFLLPRAIGYSAELLDYFFRGRLQVTSSAVFQNNCLSGLELDIKNMTATEEPISDGRFSVTVRYTPAGGNPDGSDDIFINSNTVDSGVLMFDQTSTYRFDLPEPVPLENYKSVKCMLAYHGRLGQESSAVIGKYFLPETINPCLLIEMDHEYLIWDLNEGDLKILKNGNGETVPYPVSYSDIDFYLDLYGLKYTAGLSAGRAINPPAVIFQTATPVRDCRCFFLDRVECLIEGDCGQSGGDADICNEYGENPYGFTRIERELENILEEGGYECVGFRESYDETKDYAGTCDVSIPETNAVFSFKQSMYHHHQWADICHQSAPPSSGFDSYTGPEDSQETKQTAVLTAAGLDPTERDQKRKFAFFWHQWEHDEHKEWQIIDWGKSELTVHDARSHYDYYYRSYITPSLTRESAPILSYSIESGIGDGSAPPAYRLNSTSEPVVSGFIDRFAVVLEQPVITYEKKPDVTPREVVEYWAASKIYIQSNGLLRDPTDPASGYVYDWDELAEIDMDKIFSLFSKALAEDIAERGSEAGLKISIYSGI